MATAKKKTARKHSAKRGKKVVRKPSQVEVADNDAGATSLLGYIYQLMGSGATALKLNRLEPSKGAEFRVTMECFGQDAAVAGRTIQLIQFKHSINSSLIPLSEMKKILSVFRSSVRLLASPNVVQCRIVANRRLSTDAKNCLERCNKVNRKTKKFKVSAELVSRRSIEEEIEGRARLFGNPPSDRTSQDVLGYLGRLMDLPPGSRRIQIAELDSILAGCRAPIPLVLEAQQPFQREYLANLAKDEYAMDLNAVLPRLEIDQLLDDPDVTIAAVFGAGGSGKTLSVVGALDRRLKAKTSLAGIVISGVGACESIPQLISMWRSSMPVGTESIDTLLRRLIFANPMLGRPIAVLALDGLDERQEQQEEAAQVLRCFKRLAQANSPSPATLVVTCRTSHELDRYLASDATAGTGRKIYKDITLEEFTAAQLRRAWKLWFPDDPPLRLPDASAPISFGGDETGKVISPVLADALRHPVVLGRVRLLSPEYRQKLLDGEDAALIKLAELFCGWFVFKSLKRNPAKEINVRTALHAIANATVKSNRPNGPFTLSHDWVDVAVRETGLDRGEAKELYNDAATSGLVTVDSLATYQSTIKMDLNWRWRFAFISDYLANHMK